MGFQNEPQKLKLHNLKKEYANALKFFVLLPDTKL